MTETDQMYGANVEPEDEELPAGFLVDGRYAIDGFLARGGFATVYRAHHVQIERAVAIKVLEPPRRKSGSQGFEQRFLQEAKIAARISHPGVVDVFDFGMLDDGRAYIAMDLLVGHDLEEELERNGPMKASRLVPLVADCLGALQEGHEQGIVHKDLKPSNLFLVRPGTPHERLVILDFGIARVFADPGAKVTQEGGFSGTPAYLAPEYIRGQQVSPAIDVYQVGLILLELLTGVPAIYADNSMGYLLAHCLNPVILPTVLQDTELGEVCLEAVAKSPEERWSDAGEFRDALLGIARLDLFDTEPLDMVPPRTTSREETIDGAAKTLQFIEVTQQQFQTALHQAAPHGIPEPSDDHVADTIEGGPVSMPTEPAEADTMKADPMESNRRLVRQATILALVVVLAAIVVVFTLFLVTTDSSPTDGVASQSGAAAEQPAAFNLDRTKNEPAGLAPPSAEPVGDAEGDVVPAAETEIADDQDAGRDSGEDSVETSNNPAPDRATADPSRANEKPRSRPSPKPRSDDRQPKRATEKTEKKADKADESDPRAADKESTPLLLSP